ncbi:MAG: hypothetical protein HYX79_03430 [Chloroflexi bacterium]|nr:hypothetical protein [Chloroflexota bacterium]
MGNVNAVLLIAGILFVFGFAIGLLFWITKSGVISGKARTPVRLIGLLFILLVTGFLLINLRNISTPDRWVNLSLTAGLVGMTALYASITFKQAEEMRQQRFTTSQPLVFPDFSEARFPKPGRILFVNLGSGPALDLKITFAYCTPEQVKREWIERKGPFYSMASIGNPNWSIVRASDRVSCQPDLANTNKGNVGTAVSEYSDIYGRRFLTGWGYRFEEDGEGSLIMQSTEPLYPVVREVGGEK